jgi:hypothetical protein
MGDVNEAVTKRVDGIYLNTRDEVLKESGLDVETEDQIPPDVKEKIDGIADFKLKEERREIEKDPSTYRQQLVGGK